MKRFDIIYTREKLDRAMATKSWLNIFNSILVMTLVSPTSDHDPILIYIVSGVEVGKCRSLKFNNSWLCDPELSNVVIKSWQEASNRGIMQKKKDCIRALSTWGKNRNMLFWQQKKAIVSKLEFDREADPGNCNQLLKDKLAHLLAQEECRREQQAKQFWLIHGDRNKRFFRSKIKSRRQNNKIMEIMDANGRWSTDVEVVKHSVVNYFSQIFAQQDSDKEEVLNLVFVVRSKIEKEDNVLLTEVVRYKEVKEVVFHMHSDKAPGLDVLNPVFFQKFWSIVDGDIILACNIWLQAGTFPSSLPNTTIIMILKISDPKEVKDFRPIALCNVLYKILSKVLANKLQNVLHKVISKCQSAFILRRTITDNILVSFEMMHYLQK